MDTLFLSGQSPNNKVWMYETVASIPEIHFLPFEWQHWETGEMDLTKFDWATESSRIVDAVPGQVNILAKSLGTMMTAYLLANKLITPNKVILNGIPINGLTEENKSWYRQALSDFPIENLEIIHNENDKVGTAASVQEFLVSLNPNIKVVVKPRDDHSYPYPDDFRTFLE